MLNVILIIISLSAPITGYAAYSAEGVAELVITNRASWGQDVSCPTCPGYAAVADCSKIGQYLWLHKAGEFYGPLRVHDCTKALDRNEFESLGRIVEVSWSIAELWTMTKTELVTLYWGKTKPNTERLITDEWSYPNLSSLWRGN